MTTAYCTLADVKAFSGQTTSMDATITSLLLPVSAAIDRYTNRDFSSHSGIVENLNGNGNYKIAPAFAPLLAVTSVIVDNVTIPSSLDSQSYGFTFDSSLIYIRNSSSDNPFTRGVQNVKVSYSAGYAAVPDDIRQAAIELIIYRINKRDRMDKKSEILGGQTVAYDMAEMPRSVTGVLNRWRNWNR